MEFAQWTILIIFTQFISTLIVIFYIAIALCSSLLHSAIAIREDELGICRITKYSNVREKVDFLVTQISTKMRILSFFNICPLCFAAVGMMIIRNTYSQQQYSSGIASQVIL
jgi:hypothetical protein